MLVFHKMTVQLMKIQRVESSETTWSARRQVVACAAVCRSWREVTKEVVKTLKECGRITFPMSLKQVGTLCLFSTLMINHMYVSFNCNKPLTV
ncbi:tubby-like F-box protein 5 [Zea mays]|uniref:tubby-like F-box protein 5 n=1 Tax=Zea mays TaxID=4577 RepID=UPI0004DE9BF9|nr:tubby-like F-box protein 5 [Zea mays]